MRIAPRLARVARPSKPRSAAITLAGNLAGALTAFAAALIAARTLDRPEFAVFGIGLAFNSLAVQLADLGLNIVTVAETADDWDAGRVAVSRAKLRHLAVHRVSSTAVVAGLLISVGMAIPALMPYRGAIIVAALGAVFGSLSLFTVAILQGARRFAHGAVVLFIVGSLRLALVAGAAALGLSALEMLVGYALLAPLAGTLVGLLLLGVWSPWAASREPVVLDRRLRRLMGVGGVAAACLFNLDVLILALISDQTEVAIYVAAWRVAAGVSLFNSSLASALLPHIMVARDIRQEVQGLVRVGLALSCGMLLLVPVFTFVGLTLLGSAGEDAGLPLVLLLVAFGLDTFVYVVFQVYIKVGRTSMPVANVVIELVVMVVITVLARDLGAVAPALGQLAARVVGVLFLGLPLALARAGRLDWFGGPPAAAPRSP